MKPSHLTAKYRPQRFSEVAGQDAVKTVLSRAAAEDRIAPAYLFSGTRGTGKTTLARILAKAVNCETAPTAEPCNKCRFCTQITAGSQVDVIEIDAASHTGVDNVRSLKEDIGYAPMEARYKVFIVDEAHMLSKSAFNALLKTLEEPPGHATFILASTEPEKFPATIISRCQHYLFKSLPQARLEEHLRFVLDSEERGYEPDAVALIARRGAGSVRDSMSLLSQGLALGGETLTAADVRSILGLAGQEVFLELMQAVHAGDCPQAGRVLRGVLDQGLDLGFFLRELAATWRNMFLLRQSGEAALDLVDLPEAEARQWLEWAGKFDLGRIHASWQLTLEGQRQVLKSLEPALALELLLFNLASLPQLLDLDSLGSTPQGPGSRGPSGSGGPASSDGSAGSGGGFRPPPGASGPSNTAGPATPARPGRPMPPRQATAAPASPARSRGAEPAPRPEIPAESAPAMPAIPDGPRSWEAFAPWAEACARASGETMSSLRGVVGCLEDGQLLLKCMNEAHCGLLGRGEGFATLQRYAADYFGPDVAVRTVAEQAAPTKSLSDIREEVKDHPAVKQVMDRFGAQLIDVRRPRQDRTGG